MAYVINNSGVDLVNWGRGLGDTLSQALIQAPLQRQQQLMQIAQLMQGAQQNQIQSGFRTKELGIEQQQADTAGKNAASEAEYRKNIGEAQMTRAKAADQNLMLRTEASKRESSLAAEIAKLRVENARLKQPAGLSLPGGGNIPYGAAGNVLASAGGTNALAPLAAIIQQALKGQGAPQQTNAPPQGLRVRNKQTGQTGTLTNPQEFDPNLYDRIQ